MHMNRRPSMVAFHWLTALLVAASFTIAWVRSGIDDLDARALWLDVHRSIGFVILALTLVRFASRLRGGTISRREQLPPAMWLASRLTHFLMYAVLVAMPLLGWAQSSAGGRHFAVFGVTLPRLIRHNPDLADSLGWWHAQLGWALLALIALHVAAALFHHFVRRDHLVRAMLPGYRPWRAQTPPEVRIYDMAA